MDKVMFTPVAISSDIDPEGGYSMRIQERDAVDESRVFEEVVSTMSLPIPASLLEYAFVAIIQAMTGLIAKDCRPRSIAGKMRLAPYLTGKVQYANAQFSAATCGSVIRGQLLSNDVRVIDTSRIEFVNALAAAANLKKPVVKTVSWIGSTGTNEVKVGQPFAAYGDALVFKPAYGDTAKITYDNSGTPTDVNLTVTVSDDAHIAFAWPEALADLDEGVELTVTIVSRGGVEDAPAVTNVKKVTVVI